jgi:LAO/AO transport system kinase
VWETINRFRKHSRQTELFQKRRQAQSRQWLHTLLKEQLMEALEQNTEVALQMPDLEEKVIKGEISTTKAATRLIETFLSGGA